MRKRLAALLSLLFLACACMLISCTRQTHGVHEPGTQNHARLLSLIKTDGGTLALVKNPADTTRLLASYFFALTDTTPLPPHAKEVDAMLLKPSALKKLLVYSGVHASALEELGASQRIAAVGDAGYFTQAFIKDGLSSGKIVDAGTQAAPSIEKIMSTAPGAIILSQYDGLDASALERLGIPIIYMCESGEETPLGRAEWIKLMGLLANREAKADSIFTATADAYESLQLKAKGAKERPGVLTENMYQGVWSVPGAESYAARMIADAGGNYVFASRRGDRVLSLPFEAVLAEGRDADIWLMRFFDQDLTITSLRAQDERYMLFAPAKNTLKNLPAKGIWSCNTGRVPFYEETPFHPDRLLEDYIRIFHPGLLEGGDTKYFKKVTR